MRRLGAVMAIVFCLGGSLCAPALAWRGGWHGRWGWHPRVGLALGWGPYWGYPYADPYYPYGPYWAEPYDGPYTYDESMRPDEAATETAPPAANGASRRDLSGIERLVEQRKAQVQFDYDDGDISAAERETRSRDLDVILEEARREAAANGGALTGDQETALRNRLEGRRPRVVSPSPAAPAAPSATPGSSVSGLATVTDLLSEMRVLLDQKAKEGAITAAQREGEARYLDQLDQEARSAAQRGGGSISAADEQSLVRRLHQVYYALQHNLVVP